MGPAWRLLTWMDLMRDLTLGFLRGRMIRYLVFSMSALWSRLPVRIRPSEAMKGLRAQMLNLLFFISFREQGRRTLLASRSAFSVA